jgi:hypothetical protein
MAITNLILTTLATNLFQDTVNGNVGIAVKASAGTFFVIHVDNSANAGAASYVKLYDSATTPSVGTTVPDWVIKVPGAFVGNVLIATAGIAFSAGLQVATVTAGGTAGVTAPTSAVIVRIAYT